MSQILTDDNIRQLMSPLSDCIEAEGGAPFPKLPDGSIDLQSPGLANFFYVIIKTVDKGIATSFAPIAKLFELKAKAQDVVEAIAKPDELPSAIAGLSTEINKLIEILQKLQEGTPFVTFPVNEMISPISENIAFPLTLDLGISVVPPVSIKPELVGTDKDFIGNTLGGITDQVKGIQEKIASAQQKISEVTSKIQAELQALQQRAVELRNKAQDATQEVRAEIEEKIEAQRQALMDKKKQLIDDVKNEIASYSEVVTGLLAINPITILKPIIDMITIPIKMVLDLIPAVFDIVKDLVVPSPDTAKKIIETVNEITTDPIGFIIGLVEPVLTPVVEAVVGALPLPVDPQGLAEMVGALPTIISESLKIGSNFTIKGTFPNLKDSLGAAYGVLITITCFIKFLSNDLIAQVPSILFGI